MSEPEPEAEDSALPKLTPCVCDVRNPKDGRCVACGGAVQPANALSSSSEDAAVAQITSMGFSEPAAQRGLMRTGGNVERAVQWVMGHLDDDQLNEPLPASDEPAEMLEEPTALFSFGVVADVQYADLPVGTNFLKTVHRYYRHSLDALALAVQSWLHDAPGGSPVAFVAQLGDLIDGKNADHGQTASAVADVHGVLLRLGSIPIHSAIGNHEVMNWPRAILTATPGEIPTVLSATHLRDLATPSSESGPELKAQDGKASIHGYRADLITCNHHFDCHSNPTYRMQQRRIVCATPRMEVHSLGLLRNINAGLPARSSMQSCGLGATRRKQSQRLHSS